MRHRTRLATLQEQELWAYRTTAALLQRAARAAISKQMLAQYSHTCPSAACGPLGDEAGLKPFDGERLLQSSLPDRHSSNVHL